MPNEMLVAPSGRPAASLSLDLDNLWSYLMTAGDERWRAYPTYLPRFVPNVLELLDTLQLNITFFVVGADARRDENGAALQSIVAAGHEVGNHSDRHEPWLLRQSRAALEEDIEQAEDAITLCAGARPRGYRGPGFSCNVDVLEVLAQRGYRYDASTWPTFVGPIARRFYFAS
ncbi:MAG: polysaccharide deacetylase family protein, partial [Gemmatimonadaceae bacterium]